MLQQVAGALVLRHGLNLLLWSLRHLLRVSIEIAIALRSRVSTRPQAEWLRRLSSRCLHLLVMLLCLHLLHQSLVLVDFLLDLVLLLLVIVGSLHEHHDAVIVGLGVSLFARHGL